MADDDEEDCGDPTHAYAGYLVKNKQLQNTQEQESEGLTSKERAKRLSDLAKRRKAQLTAKKPALKPAVRFIGDLTSINDVSTLEYPIEIVSSTADPATLITELPMP